MVFYAVSIKSAKLLISAEILSLLSNKKAPAFVQSGAFNDINKQ